MVSTHTPWIFGAGCLFAALFAYGLGANDVANSFGTSIGSGALTMKHAIAIASVMEVLGAVTLGSGVADTLTKKISYLEREDCWDCSGQSNKMGVYELGMVCSLASGALFLICATLFGLPVSTTHTIVGAVLGMTVVATHAMCVKWLWPGLLKIVASWFVSPLLAGFLSVLLHGVIKRLVLRNAYPLHRAYVALPILTGSTIFVLAMLIMYQGSTLPLWQVTAISTGVGLGFAALVQVFAISRVKKRIEKAVEIQMQSVVVGGGEGGSNKNKNVLQDHHQSDESATEQQTEGGEKQQIQLQMRGDDGDDDDNEEEEEESSNLIKEHETEAELETVKAKRVFMYLQILTATLKSFAHGANDVANAAGPIAAIQGLYFSKGEETDCSITTSIWMLILAGVGIVLGLSISGHHVIKTIGKDLTAIDFPTGFSIELGSTLSVVLASCTGMPVSSTHCQVGSIICIGIYENGAKHVKWSMLNKIIASWLITVPISAFVSGLMLWLVLLIIQ
jgi:sodium-dependent phosphate transporter